MTHLLTKSWYLLFLFIFLFYFSLHALLYEASALGANFFVAAPPALSLSFASTHIHNIYIGTTYFSANYTIENNFGTLVNSGTAMYSDPGVYNIDGFQGAFVDSVFTSGFADRNKCLPIMATGSESVFVLYILGEGEFYGSYLAYPCVEFQEDVYEYYAI